MHKMLSEEKLNERKSKVEKESNETTIIKIGNTKIEKVD